MSKSSMQAIVIEGGKGPPEALRLASQPVPQPKEGEILIAVKAAGVNRPDLVQRIGQYQPPPGVTDIMGLEVAGEVVKAAGRWKEGDRVCALLAGGGYAEYAVCDARHALPIPAGLDFVQAAGLPETVFTVYANVYEHGALKPGQTLLVHGATSGIGVTAIQMAKAAGAKVIATGRGADRKATALQLGADVAVDATAEDFAAVAKAEGGVDVVLEMVAGDYLKKDVEALNPGGRIVFIANLAGAEACFPVFHLMRKQAVITGSLLRPRSADEKARLAAEVERVAWPWVAAGKVRPAIAKTFPLAQAGPAQAYLEAGGHVGKVVLVA
jgi:putative PIG3 family NAD(P)H quinone oxidoreductase